MIASHSHNALVARPAQRLGERDVSYCHWKSNATFVRSEIGENDLDLLVARSHAEAFRETPSSLGFTRVERRGKPLPPGKEDYFGHDAASGKLVHHDVHYYLVVGYDRTKNGIRGAPGPVALAFIDRYRTSYEMVFAAMERPRGPLLLRCDTSRLSADILASDAVEQLAQHDSRAGQSTSRGGPS